jgi:hypothetical protein
MQLYLYVCINMHIYIERERHTHYTHTHTHTHIHTHTHKLQTHTYRQQTKNIYLVIFFPLLNSWNTGAIDASVLGREQEAAGTRQFSEKYSVYCAVNILLMVLLNTRQVSEKYSSLYCYIWYVNSKCTKSLNLSLSLSLSLSLC